jgi:hypothetical protein
MKKNHFYASVCLFFLLNSVLLSAQTVGYTVVGGTCAGTFTLTLGAQVNGKNSYSGTGAVIGVSTISWSGSRWEINNSLGGLQYYNTAATALNPPCFNVGTFVATGFCTGGTITNSSGDCAMAIVPIELMDFQAHLVNNNAIELTWQTASEINNRGFQIERSTDGGVFNPIEFVKSQGDSKMFKSYQFIDNQFITNANNYYRLRQIDNDGKEMVSKTVSIKTASKGKIVITPNPARTHVSLNFEGEQGVLNIYDLVGKVVLTKKINANDAQLIDVSILAAGHYILEITSNKQVFKEKLVKI